jgi:hypothetical protein
LLLWFAYLDELLREEALLLKHLNNYSFRYKGQLAQDLSAENAHALEHSPDLGAYAFDCIIDCLNITVSDCLITFTLNEVASINDEPKYLFSNLQIFFLER